jgi:hypothetical protein
VIDLADPSGVRLRSPVYQVSREYTGFFEGPNPDISTLDGIDSIDELESDFISPFNHKSPDRGDYPSKVSVVDDRDVFSSTVTSEKQKPITFDWAEKIIDSGEFQDNASWNAVEWDEDSYSGVTNTGVSFTGVDWEFADWNKFPYTDFGVVGEDSIQTSETVEDKLFDRKIEESVISDKQDIIPEISFNKTVNTGIIDEPSSDISFTLTDGVASSTDNWDIFDWNTATWSDNTDNDKLSLDIIHNSFDTVLFNDTVLYNVDNVAWNSDTWGSLRWNGNVNQLSG